jgi:peptide-methionine (S)-S-oxide reductase
MADVAMFGAGCFWGVEAAFRSLVGVLAPSVGYAGGSVEHPSYQQVCSNTTGHVEVVRVEYDSETVAYEDLLKLFYEIHDPTTPNRQGPDIGTQYRSVIFFTTPAQKQIAEAFTAKLEQAGTFKRPIVTKIEPAPTFYRAEEYHQRYLEKHGHAACRVLPGEKAADSL